MKRIFISHVEEDAQTAFEIALNLEEAGYRTWLYEFDSIPGKSYLIQTKEAIEQSVAVVVIISHHSLGSAQITKEVVRAHESDTHFIPLLRDVKHVEFQNRQPEWREAIGAATSINIPKGGVSAINERIIDGLKALNITPQQKSDHTKIEQLKNALEELKSGRKFEVEHKYKEESSEGYLIARQKRGMVADIITRLIIAIILLVITVILIKTFGSSIEMVSPQRLIESLSEFINGLIQT